MFYGLFSFRILSYIFYGRPIQSFLPRSRKRKSEEEIVQECVPKNILNSFGRSLSFLDCAFEAAFVNIL